MDPFQKVRHFRIIQDGVRLTGFRAEPSGGLLPWEKSVPFGSFLVCAGREATRDGAVAVKWFDAYGDFLAQDCVLQPSTGSEPGEGVTEAY